MNTGLSGRAARSTALVAGATYLNQGLGFAANVALMRLIAPAHFGSIALGLFFLSLCRRVFGLGINHALVHRQDDLERGYGVHLTLNVSIAALTLLVVQLAAPLVEARYGGDVVSALWAFALVGMVESAGHTPRLALEKQLQFGRLMAVRLANTVVINLVAIGMALAGYGLQALIARYALGLLLETVLLWIVSPVRPRPQFDYKLGRWFVGFGAHLWLAGLATFVLYQLDDWCVGTLLGVAVLGFYNRSYNLSLLPTSMISQVVAKVAFPVYARLQCDRAALSAAFGAFTRGVCLLTMPFAALLLLIAPELVRILFGTAWLPMIPLLRALILFSLARPLFDNTGDLFSAVGDPRTISRIMLGQACGLALLLWPATHWGGAVGAALAVGLVMIGGVCASYIRLRRVVDVKYREIFVGPTLAAAAALAASGALLLLLDLQGVWLVGLVKLAGFAICFGLAMLALEGRRLRDDLALALRLLRGRTAANG